MGLGTALLTILGVGAAQQPLPAATVANIIARPKPSSATGTLITGGILDDIEHNSDLVGTAWHGEPGTLGIAGKMMRDPHVRKSVDYTANPLSRADWRFRPASDQPIDLEIADFAQYAIVECLPFSQIVRRIVRGYFQHGVHLEEPTDEIKAIPADRFPNHPGNGLGLIPTALHHVPIPTIDGWNQARVHTDRIESVRQFVTGSDQEDGGYRDIPADRLIRWTYDQEGADFTGNAILRSAYQPWKVKIALLKIDAIKHERTGVGTPVAIGSEEGGADEAETIEAILKGMRANSTGYAYFPHGVDFDWKGLGEGATSDSGSAIQRCNVDIAINVGAGFMLLGLTGKTGSFALGSTQQGQYQLEVDGHAAFVADALNSGPDGWSMIERIVRANYGPAVDLPRLEARNLPTRDWLKRAETVFKGVQVGAITPDSRLERQLRDSMQLDPHDPETAREQKAAAPQNLTTDDTADEENEEAAA